MDTGILRDLLLNLVAGLVGGVVVALILEALERRRWQPLMKYEMGAPRARLHVWTWKYARSHGVPVRKVPIGDSKPTEVLTRLPVEPVGDDRHVRLLAAIREGEQILDSLIDGYHKLPFAVRDPKLPETVWGAALALGDYGDLMEDALNAPSPQSREELRGEMARASAVCKERLAALWSALGDEPAKGSAAPEMGVVRRLALWRKRS